MVGTSGAGPPHRRPCIGRSAAPSSSGLPRPASGREDAQVLLTAHNLIFPKTHNLEELVSLAQTIDMNLAAFGPAARILTPYANRFRYPGGPLQPEPSVAREAITLAREIYDDVQQRLIGGGSS